MEVEGKRKSRMRDATAVTNEQELKERQKENYERLQREIARRAEEGEDHASAAVGENFFFFCVCERVVFCTDGGRAKGAERRTKTGSESTHIRKELLRFPTMPRRFDWWWMPKTKRC